MVPLSSFYSIQNTTMLCERKSSEPLAFYAERSLLLSARQKGYSLRLLEVVLLNAQYQKQFKIQQVPVGKMAVH
jgi:hypothetical protein